ncbi:MAG: helix-turn-helix domain-containing protein [Spirochaetaceae bacterium]|jgi:transcriptional regulator with XRE-family HTH domain|nr:helix-turn-helix domain-containing protein [Spirochaetaceae bacterium]
MYLEHLVIENIKRIRKEKGITQERLAEACETSTSYIGLMETFQNIPKLSTIEKIAAALGIHPAALFFDSRGLPGIREQQISALKANVLSILDSELDSALRSAAGIG